MNLLTRPISRVERPPRLAPQRWAPRAAMMLIAVACAACSGGSSASTTATPSVPASEEQSSTAVPSAAPSADDSAPDELQGLWEATITTGEDVTLELRASGYTVNRGGAVGSGSISVDGSQIVFSTTLCQLGKGPYEWSIEGETLTFTPLEPRDPCGNRIIFLEGASYTRVE